MVRLLLFVACSSAAALGQPVTVRAVVNAASFDPRIAIGSLASIFGDGLATTTAQATALPLPMTLGGTTVEICLGASECYASPLVFVSPRQINFFVRLPGLEATPYRVVVKRGTVQGSGVAGLTPNAPGIFAVGYDCPLTGSSARCGLSAEQSPGQIPRAAMTDQQGRIIQSSNPARFGEAYTLWFTGIGDTRPFQFGFTEDYRSWAAADLRLYRSPIASQSSDGSAEILFLGPSPQFPGLYQLNFKVPATIASVLAPCSTPRMEVWFQLLLRLAGSNSFSLPLAVCP
jgi:uncharacterized protein (TIGR03437 family)